MTNTNLPLEECTLSNNTEIQLQDLPKSNDNGERKWNFSKPQALIYVSQFLSSWGDRMWLFAGGLFLIEITPDSFRLVAIYEAALALTVIIFGAVVGRWIDRSSRLIAAQLSLFIQNLMVCLCTTLLCLLITYKDIFLTSLNGWGLLLAEAVVIIMACVAQIGTLGIKLAIEKDWIVVICGKENTKLSKMNSVLRSIDLSTEMMAPVLVGFVMAGYGMVPGGILIAIWNVASFVIEYGTLHYLYNSFPALRKAKVLEEEVENTKKENFLTNMRNAVIVWKSYFGHKIRDAGIALALLFMTVLAFDNYTRAYVSSAGVTTGILGILTACASFTGIAGSIFYPILRKKVGIMRTGLIGFGSECIFLILCVIALFLPGTQFRPSYLWETQEPMVNITVEVIYPNNTSLEGDYITTHFFDNITKDGNFNDYSNLYNSSVESFDENFTPSNSSMSSSVSLLLSGIILSRFGLWIADLSVTQILQEDVDESERGAINGVQYSLNQIFNLIRNILLIILPSMETFGYLVIMSFIFVLFGFSLFLSYARNSSKRFVYDIEAVGHDNNMYDIPS